MQETLTEAQGIELVRCANLIARWCAMEDEAAPVPTSPELFVLFGGGVLGIVDTLAAAVEAGAQRSAIVGGRGHATFWLAKTLQQPAYASILSTADIDAESASEAEMLKLVAAHEYGIVPDLLETHSTNCGNNITYLLDLLEENDLVPVTLVLSQDPTMQRRMDVTWKRQMQDRPRFAAVEIYNQPAYRATLAWREGELIWEKAPRGMWRPERYLQLLSGEVERLTDDAQGYGPAGAGFIVHVDVPAEVTAAARRLRELCPSVLAPR